MIKISVNDVNPGEEFSFAGRWYARALDAELLNHPAATKPSTIPAYSLGDNKNRVPVTFVMGCQVFVSRQS